MKTVLTEDVKDFAGPDRVGTGDMRMGPRVPVLRRVEGGVWLENDSLALQETCLFYCGAVGFVHAVLGSVGRGRLRGLSRHGVVHARGPGPCEHVRSHHRLHLLSSANAACSVVNLVWMMLCRCSGPMSGKILLVTNFSQSGRSSKGLTR